MKKFKKFTLLALMFALLPLSSNMGRQEENPFVIPDNDVVAIGSIKDGPKRADEEVAVIIPDELIIHYHRDDNAYETYGHFYCWAGGADGVQQDPSKVQKDDFGIYLTCNPKEEWPSHDTFQFIIKQQFSWSGQSLDTLIPYSEFVPTLGDDGKYHLEVWAVAESAQEIVVYKTKLDAQGARVNDAYVNKDWKSIHVEGFSENGTAEIQSYKVYGYDRRYYNLKAEYQIRYKNHFLVASGDGTGQTLTEVKLDNTINAKKAGVSLLDIKLPNTALPWVIYSVEIVFKESPDRTKLKNASFEKLYDTNTFKEYFTYDGNDLGPVYTPEKTTFKLWAPTAAVVKFYRYFYATPSVYSQDGNTAVDAHGSYDMKQEANGVWSFEMTGDCHGMYYTYFIINASNSCEVVDPYVKSTGINGKRGMVVNFDAQDVTPEGWDEIPLKWDGVEGYDIESNMDLTVYEAHIRDLTADESWNGTEENRAKYAGFIEKGTKYADAHTTGFDHLVDLGFNAIQIMPFFDGANDERDPAYNWGYNPENYNVVEGGYSKNPYDGKVRIKELREVVMAFANETAADGTKMRVIMDVVYNHVSSVGSSNFNRIVPKYYFRTLEDGSYSVGSGCGNEVKTEAPMMRKFIVDSVCFWVSEYKIKGFRYDLMGLMDVDTMIAIKEALYAIDPDIVNYGEPWNMNGWGGSVKEGAWETNVYSKLYHSETSPGYIGCFNDQIRGGIKGGDGWGDYNRYPDLGFIQGTDHTNNFYKIGSGMQGANGDRGANPNQTVNYASCHDNFTLYDQIKYGLSENWRGTEDVRQSPDVYTPDDGLVGQALLSVQAVIMMSNGIAFMHGGEEILRTKIEYDEEAIEKAQYCTNIHDTWISHNSYISGDETNSYKWERKAENPHITTKIAELAKLRAEIPNYDLGEINETTYGQWQGEGSTGGVVAYRLGDYIIFFNGRDGGYISFNDLAGSTEVFNVCGTGEGYTATAGGLNHSYYYHAFIMKM